MKHYFFKTSMIVVLGAIIFSLTGCQNQENLLSQGATQSLLPVESLSKEQVLKETIPVIQGFLNAQYDYAIGKDKEPQWNQYITTGGDTLKTQIDIYKDNLYYNSSAKLISYTSKVLYDETGQSTWGLKSSISYSGDTCILSNIHDRYSLTDVIDGKHYDGDTGHGGNLYQTVVLKRIQGKWMITSWEEHGVIGNSYRWFIRRERLNADLSVSMNTSPMLKATAATTYNRTAAKTYASNYYIRGNVSLPYPDYSNYGGDCTNFVSQCLEAGGWTQTSKVNGRSSSLSWYHDKGYTSPAPTSVRSTSWTEASSLANYLNNTSRVLHASYIYTAMEVGDIIQLSNSTSGIHHSMIVVSRSVASNGTITIKVAYRNSTGNDPNYGLNVTLFPSSETRKCYKVANSYGIT